MSNRRARRATPSTIAIPNTPMDEIARDGGERPSVRSTGLEAIPSEPTPATDIATPRAVTRRLR